MENIIFVEVKKTMSILILSVYLLANTQLSEILKFPILVEHFISHHDVNGMSFFAFMQMHYFSDPIKDADYETDMRLPFKSISHPVQTATAICATPAFNLTRTIFFRQNKEERYSSYCFLYASPHLNSIWQPPRTA